MKITDMRELVDYSSVASSTIFSTFSTINRVYLIKMNLEPTVTGGVFPFLKDTSIQKALTHVFYFSYTFSVTYIFLTIYVYRLSGNM